jgi:two-component system sensor histidine kinase TctE
MFSKPADSLRAQLLRWLLLPLLALLLVNAWFSNQAAVATANLAFDRLLMASADAIADDIDVKDGEIIVDLPYAALKLLESNIQERIFYRVVAPNGATLTGYDDLPLPTRRIGRSEESVFYRAHYRDEPIHLVALTRAIYGEGRTEPLVVVVAETGEARDALSHQILLDGLSRQGALIAVAAMLVWLGLLRGLKPLGRLQRSVAARAATDLGPIDPGGVQREVRPLIGALNLHMARIEGLLAGRQRFIADASHQMRTPLSEMRTQIEYTLRQNLPALSHATLIDVHADIDRLSRLMSQMLLQARSDPDAMPDQRLGPVDLSEIARTAALDLVPAARKKAIDLTFDGSASPVIVSGNALLLRELVANLIDNAIVHGPARGVVAVRVIGHHAAVLEVQDEGPGIGAAERGRVFERFYRVPGTQAAGSGLGLSIVRDICTTHHAQIALHSPTGGAGLCVRVEFPAT